MEILFPKCNLYKKIGRKIQINMFVVIYLMNIISFDLIFCRLQWKKDELKKNLLITQNFVNRLNVSLKSAENMESPENIAAALAEMLATSEKLMNQRFDLNAKISSIENDIFIANHKLKIASSSIEEIHKDINFAMKQGMSWICPVCGVHYHNGLPEQLNISSDFCLAEKLC